MIINVCIQIRGTSVGTDVTTKNVFNNAHSLTFTTGMFFFIWDVFGIKLLSLFTEGLSDSVCGLVN